jgi:hypothetical protein
MQYFAKKIWQTIIFAVNYLKIFNKSYPNIFYLFRCKANLFESFKTHLEITLGRLKEGYFSFSVSTRKNDN